MTSYPIVAMPAEVSAGTCVLASLCTAKATIMIINCSVSGGECGAFGLSLPPPGMSNHHENCGEVMFAGQRFNLDSSDVEAITDMAKDINWPRNARRVVNGRGECLGATYDACGARLGQNTSAREAFCMKLNAALARSLGNSPFQWGSLQVNVDSVSKEHCDTNNTGLSVIMLFGSLLVGDSL